MERLALPQELYADVLGSLRQRRAAGKTVTKRQERSAWSAYWDAMARRQADVRRLGMLEDQLKMQEELAKHNMAVADQQIALQQAAQALRERVAAQDAALKQKYYELQKTTTDKSMLEKAREFNEQMRLEDKKMRLEDKKMKNAENAGTVRGAMELGGLGLTAASLLKGTKLGEKIGLKAPETALDKFLKAYLGKTGSAPTTATEFGPVSATTEIGPANAATGIPTTGVTGAANIDLAAPAILSPETLTPGVSLDTALASMPTATAAAPALSALAPLQSTASLTGGVGAGVTGGFSGAIPTGGITGVLGALAPITGPLAVLAGLKALGLGKHHPYDPMEMSRNLIGKTNFTPEEYADILNKWGQGHGDIYRALWGPGATLGGDYAKALEQAKATYHPAGFVQMGSDWVAPPEMQALPTSAGEAGAAFGSNLENVAGMNWNPQRPTTTTLVAHTQGTPDFTKDIFGNTNLGGW